MHGKQNDIPIILVVDDFEDIRLTLRHWLEKRGYRVVEAEDGDKAIEVARQVHPALILMDIGMPERSGISATYKIRKDPEMDGTLIVAITGYQSADLREDALTAGCVACLTKPVDLGELDKLVSSLLATTGTSI
ncbi:MAG TPA: response regulator [Pyrinomonadaceae bacterium]